MAAVELVSIARSQSYETRTPATKLRLTAEEVRLIRYVLVDWGGECGVGSATMHEMNCETMVEQDLRGQGPKPGRQGIRLALASMPRLPKQDRKRRKWARAEAAMRAANEMIKVKGTQPYAVDHMWSQEKWADKATADERFRRVNERSECDAILGCWRTLGRMAESKSMALIVLNALYGGLPPGLPEPHLWPAAVDLEYRRVCRYTESGHGGGASLDAVLRVDKHRIGDELPAIAKSRIAVAVAHRKARLAAIAQEAEHLIVDASHAFRAAAKVGA
jgi:hypothetical protein